MKIEKRLKQETKYFLWYIGEDGSWFLHDKQKNITYRLFPDASSHGIYVEQYGEGNISTGAEGSSYKGFALLARTGLSVDDFERIVNQGSEASEEV